MKIPFHSKAEKRNTDNDWIHLGNKDPFFGVITHEKYLLENIDDDALHDFWKSGEDHIDGTIKRIEKYFHKTDINSVLDFGCGVGRLVRAMRKRIPNVTGVDISPGMLKIARENLPNDVNLLRNIPNERFDWVNSYIVFQHIHPDQGYIRFSELLDCVGSNGVFSIHITIFRDNKHSKKKAYIKRKIRKLRKIIKKINFRSKRQKENISEYISMYDYNASYLLEIAVRKNFGNFHFDHEDHGGHHGFVIFGQKLS